VTQFVLQRGDFILELPLDLLSHALRNYKPRWLFTVRRPRSGTRTSCLRVIGCSGCAGKTIREHEAIQMFLRLEGPARAAECGPGEVSDWETRVPIAFWRDWDLN